MASERLGLVLTFRQEVYVAQERIKKENMA